MYRLMIWCELRHTPLERIMSMIWSIRSTSVYHNIQWSCQKAVSHCRMRIPLKILYSKFLFIYHEAKFGIRFYMVKTKNCYTRWNLCSRLSKMWSNLLHDTGQLQTLSDWEFTTWHKSETWYKAGMHFSIPIQDITGLPIQFQPTLISK